MLPNKRESRSAISGLTEVIRKFNILGKKGNTALVCRGLNQLQESRQPGRVRWPGGRSYKIAVDVSFGPILGDKLSSRGLNFGATCRVR